MMTHLWHFLGNRHLWHFYPWLFEYNYVDILVRVCSIQLLKKITSLLHFWDFISDFLHSFTHKLDVQYRIATLCCIIIAFMINSNWLLKFVVSLLRITYYHSVIIPELVRIQQLGFSSSDVINYLHYLSVSIYLKVVINVSCCFISLDLNNAKESISQFWRNELT